MQKMRKNIRNKTRGNKRYNSHKLQKGGDPIHAKMLGLLLTKGEKMLMNPNNSEAMKEIKDFLSEHINDPTKGFLLDSRQRKVDRRLMGHSDQQEQEKMTAAASRWSDSCEEFETKLNKELKVLQDNIEAHFNGRGHPKCLTEWLEYFGALNVNWFPGAEMTYAGGFYGATYKSDGKSGNEGGFFIDNSGESPERSNQDTKDLQLLLNIDKSIKRRGGGVLPDAFPGCDFDLIDSRLGSLSTNDRKTKLRTAVEIMILIMGAVFSCVGGGLSSDEKKSNIRKIANYRKSCLEAMEGKGKIFSLRRKKWTAEHHQLLRISEKLMKMIKSAVTLTRNPEFPDFTGERKTEEKLESAEVGEKTEGKFTAAVKKEEGGQQGDIEAKVAVLLKRFPSEDFLQFASEEDEVEGDDEQTMINFLTRLLNVNDNNRSLVAMQLTKMKRENE